jgi:flagellin
MQKLYTGFKINAAKDDASGLAISEKMKNQIKALDTAKDNCEDGANMIQTAEGYMKETHDILTRMTELAEKAANGVLKDEDRDALQNEMDQLCGEIDRVASTANFNGVKLLDGSQGNSGKVRVTCEEGKGFKVEGPSSAPTEVKALGTNIVVNTLGAKVDTTTTDTITDNSTSPATTTTVTNNTYKAGVGINIPETSGLKDGKIYQVTTASAAGTDLTKTTVAADEITHSDGTASALAGSPVTITIKAQKGDTVSFDGSATATSSNGLQFTGADVAKLKGATYTFDGTNWISDVKDANGDNVKLTGGDDLKMKAPGLAGDKFVYDKALAKNPASTKNGIDLQIGDSSTTADRLKVSINSFHSDTLFGGLDGLVNTSSNNTDTAATAAVKIKTDNSASTYKDAVSIDITDKDAASAAADAIRQISSYVSDERGKLGAQQNRLEHTVNNLTTSSENITAAKSRILDTDMAKEMMSYTSKNVIAQAAQSMLAQANSQPQNVLSLLQ